MSWKWGGRVRESFLRDTSVNNFGGTFTFFGGIGPELNADNQAIAGTTEQLSALEVYRRTLLFQQEGLSAAQIRALGGGASQFSLSAGTPTTPVNQLDTGLFVNDDWRARPNLTFSYGLRYEAQTNIGDHGDFAPRASCCVGHRWRRQQDCQDSAARGLRNLLRSHRDQRHAECHCATASPSKPTRSNPI
jgi:outer membrane receptor protein involved in Fe transport